MPAPVLPDEIGQESVPSRHTMRYVRDVDRDVILKNLFTKLAAFIAGKD